MSIFLEICKFKKYRNSRNLEILKILNSEFKYVWRQTYMCCMHVCFIGLYVDIHAWVSLYIHMYEYIHAYYVCMNIYISVYRKTCMNMYVCMHACIYKCIPSGMFLGRHTWGYIVYVCTHVWVYMSHRVVYDNISVMFMLWPLPINNKVGLVLLASIYLRHQSVVICRRWLYSLIWTWNWFLCIRTTTP